MPRERNAQGQFIRAESIFGSIGNEADGDNNMVEENPGENPERSNPGRMNSRAAASGELVVPVLEKAEPVKLVSFNIEKLMKTNVRYWTSRMRMFLRMQACWRVVELTEELKDNPERMVILSKRIERLLETSILQEQYDDSYLISI
jgi:hypothetical protein